MTRDCISRVDTWLTSGKQRVHGSGVGDHSSELGPHVLAKVRRFHSWTGGTILQDKGVSLLQPKMSIWENFVREGMDDDVARVGIINIVQTVARTGVKTQRSTMFKILGWQQN